eukprot:scaffold135894_cov34-Prasinocladus_malaysianus.AAC.1
MMQQKLPYKICGQSAGKLAVECLFIKESKEACKETSQNLRYHTSYHSAYITQHMVAHIEAGVFKRNDNNNSPFPVPAPGLVKHRCNDEGSSARDASM